MKKIDTFYLSDKQIAELKNKKTQKKAAKGGIGFLVALASILSLGFVPNLLQKIGVGPETIGTIETVLKGIATTGVIGSALSFSNIGAPERKSQKVPDSVLHSLGVDRSEVGYYGRHK